MNERFEDIPKVTQTFAPVGLDAEELTHLAARLAAQERFDQAIMYLKAALVQEPDNPQTNYLLGAQYAQIGMVERAVQRMLHAVSQDPNLLFASFQAGMLCMTAGRAQEAMAAWEPLHKLDAEHPLHLMVNGLEALARDDFETCQRYLQRGIANNNVNHALNEDLRKILLELEQRTARQSANDNIAPTNQYQSSRLS